MPSPPQRCGCGRCGVRGGAVSGCRLCALRAAWRGVRCAPAARGRGKEGRGARGIRHAPSRRLRHRPRAYHGLLPRHREREGMLHVPKRHQSCGSIIKAVLRGGLFCCLSARSVRRLYMPVFLFYLLRFTPQKPTPLNLPVCYALIV